MKLSKNKYLEICFHKQIDWDWFDLNIKITSKNKEHKGFYFYFELIGLCFEFDIYDIRHTYN